MVKDLRSRRFAVQRRKETAQETQQARLEAARQEIEAACAEAADRLRQLYEQRRQRVERVANTMRRNLGKRVEEERSRYLGGLQFRKRKAEVAHQGEWNRIESRLAQWEEGLHEAAQNLRLLEKRARIALGSHSGLKALLPSGGAPAASEEEIRESRDTLLATLNRQLEEGEAQLRACLAKTLAGFFRTVPLSAAIVAALAIGGITIAALLPSPDAILVGVATGGGLAVLFWLLHFAAGGQVRPAALSLAQSLKAARATESAILGSLAQLRAREKERLDQQLETERAAIQNEWDNVDHIAKQFEQHARAKLAEQPQRVLSKIARALDHRLLAIENERARRVAAAAHELCAGLSGTADGMEAELEKLAAEESRRQSDLEAEWNSAVLPLYEKLARLQNDAALQPRVWTEDLIAAWNPPGHFPERVRLGQITLDLAVPEGSLPQRPALVLPSGGTMLTLPLTLGFPDCGGLLIETDGPCDEKVAAIFNQAILSILTASPAGKAAFTILDPVGLGQNFAGLMHLADYEEQLINRRIWTQRDQIDERLAELNEHIEKVIQMYLRNEYETITQYNEHAGSVAEKYHFLVLADFPANFTETSMQRLQSIILTGARCGVFVFMHWNRQQKAPEGFTPEELRKGALCLRQDGRGFSVDDSLAKAGAVVTLDAPPAPELELALVHRIGKASVDSNRVEVPFETIAPEPGRLWEDSTTHELRVPIGRTGATKLQYLAIGKGTRQHALFAGKTGSGKSTLFHVIITNLSLHCSPDEVEFYLIDFKKGVEFKCYAENQLPHARVIAIESDREFGLSVLQRVDEELKRRGDLFRALGAQDIPGYKKAGGAESMPRCLLIIDEFQEFFVEDDTVAQNASVLFDRIVRQGRAFGIHVLLGSQTLGGAYTLARATLGQMVIRVALQCNEADAALIMDENNPAPRLLTRPGEGIYNDAAGAVEGNSPFQVVWIGDETRDRYLRQIRELARARRADREPPIVFEGNAPADVTQNTRLAALLKNRPDQPPAIPVVWLGAPNAIKGPTEVAFPRQSGSHLLIVGQREEAITTMLGLSLIALAAQHPQAGVQFYFFHSAAPGTADAAFLEDLFPRLPHPVTVARAHDVDKVMQAIHDELLRRNTGGASGAPPVFVLVHGLHKFKKLRHEDDMDFSFGGSDEDSGPKPGAMFNALITEGAALGMHLVATLDTYNNVARCLSRKALTEFETRVVFQMSANDSASLIDSTKAADLGLHRALLYSEQQGTLETFRPYALPQKGWLERLPQA